MKDSFSSLIKTKVALSYFFLLLLSATTIFITYNEIKKLTNPDEQEAVSKDKTLYINEIIFKLYETESIIAPMIIDTSEFNLYLQKVDLIKAKIDTLKSFSFDSVSKNQLDTIFILLDQKEENLRNLTSLFNKNSIENLYKKNIQKAIFAEDITKSFRKVEQKVIVKQDTILYNKPAVRKNFFKRLFEAFSTPDPDSSIQVLSSEYTIIDSLINFYNPADSIYKIFTDIQSNIQAEKARLGETLLSELNRLRKSNDLITTKMNHILLDFEKEEFDHSLLLLQKRENAVSRVTHIIAIIAAVSLFIIILFGLLIWKDISKSRLYRKQLEEANRETQKLMENREKLMLSITHDIKAPLGSIIGYLELLSSSKLTERQSHYLENMKNSSEHLLLLITDILDFNSLDSGNFKLNVLPFNEKKLFDNIFTAFQPLANRKGIKLNYLHRNEIKDAETVIGDPLRIRQIVNNLISNAIKFTEKGEISLQVDVSLKEKNVCLLQIDVRDTGIGIDRENQDLIFQEYVRVGTERSVEGFGLGLSIVKKLVEIQDGEISLSSEKGKGSSFGVTIPLPIAPQQANLFSYKIPPKILVIDDDKSQLTMISEQLKSKGLTPTTCHKPDLALEIIERESFDMIFTDIQMPDFNGFEIIKQIRNAHFSTASTIPVIALSARADISLSQFKEYGFSSFLNKPFTASQLFAVVSEFIPMENSSLETDIPESGKDKFAKLLSFAGGDIDSEQAILQSFIDENEKNIENLLLFKKNEDLIQINQLAHKMLAIFRMLDEKEIVIWLTEMEKKPTFSSLNEKQFSDQIEKIKTILNEANERLSSYN